MGLHIKQWDEKLSWFKGRKKKLFQSVEKMKSFHLELPASVRDAHLDLNLVESLAVVHADHGADHLWQDHHVPQVGLHHLWFLHRRSLFLRFTQPLEEGLVFAAQAAVQPPPLAGAVQLHQLLAAETRHTEG